MDNPSAVVGRLGLSIAVQPDGPMETAADLDSAAQSALNRTTGNTIISFTPLGPAPVPPAAGTGAWQKQIAGQQQIAAQIQPGNQLESRGLVVPGLQIGAFGPAEALFAPAVISMDSPGTLAVTLNGGERFYVCADPTAPNQRWVDVPGLKPFYRLPDADRELTHNTWADLLVRAVPGLDHDTAYALAIPTLRIMLAHHGAAAFPVSTVHRGEPSVDAGGVVNGVTLPTPRLPLREPDCYLAVIGQVEGRLESINAWDIDAGISLGVIQFNTDQAAFFRFLWQLWTDDPDLFGTALTTPLGWTMIWDVDHPDLLAGPDILHGRAADRARNAAYLQTGQIGGLGRNGPYRRELAAALRDCVVWPHVQDLIVDTSAWYLQPALAAIQAAGIGPLDTTAPDHDTFVLTAMLLSGRVRYSGCLAHVLAALRPWPTVAQKLAHWPEALAATTAPCPTLAARLKSQQEQAESVYQQIVRLLA